MVLVQKIQLIEAGALGGFAERVASVNFYAMRLQSPFVLSNPYFRLVEFRIAEVHYLRGDKV